MPWPLRTYPHGAPSWIDVVQPDLEAARQFYGELFGWTFMEWPVDAAEPYLVALVDGASVAGMAACEAAPTWRAYISVQDLGAITDAAIAAGATQVSAVKVAGTAGRCVSVTDPQGARIAFWEPGDKPGVQARTIPGGWAATGLRSSAPRDGIEWYTDLLPWQAAPADDVATMLCLPGYGRHRAESSDPDLHERHQSGPSSSADAVVWVYSSGLAPAAWTVAFAVGDRDRAAARAEQLGATILSFGDTVWSRGATLRDPQGAEFELLESGQPPPA